MRYLDKQQSDKHVDSSWNAYKACVKHFRPLQKCNLRLNDAVSIYYGQTQVIGELRKAELN